MYERIMLQITNFPTKVIFSLILIFAVRPGFAVAQREESVKPGVNTDFLDPDLSVEDYLKKFEVESREVYAHRPEIIKQLDLRPGMKVADIGSGTGAYLNLFSESVGKEGFVYAVDISPKFITYLRERCKRESLENVEVVRSDERTTGLSPNSVDVAFVCDTYHHFEFPKTTVQSIRDSLKTGGMLVVVDFDRVPGKSREWVVSHVRAGKEDFRKEIEASGLKWIDEPKIDGLKENFMMRFRK